MKISIGLFLIPVFLLACLQPAFCEVLILENGDRVEGRIINKDETMVEINVNGLTRYYLLDEISKIEDSSAAKEEEPQAAAGDKDLESLRLDALESFKNKEYSQALSSIREMSEIAPDNPELYLALGVVKYYLSQYEEAKEAFGKALELRPDSPEAYLLLGIVADAAGEEGPAKEDFLKAKVLFNKSEIDLKTNMIVDFLLKK